MKKHISIAEQNSRIREVIDDTVSNLKIPRESIILDIGCADIRPYSDFLLNYFQSYIGGDINDKELSKARKKAARYKNASLFRVNIESLCFKENTFDLIICNNMLASTNKAQSLREMIRILKKDGYCLSYYNNTISYSFHKILHPVDKPWLIEAIHSIIVIFNTIAFFLLKRKFFRTTFNTIKEFDKILNQLPLQEKKVFFENEVKPYKTICFIIKK